jgi:hypothetical protein
MGIMMLRAVVHARAHRSLPQFENRIRIPRRRLDYDVSALLANIDFLHSAKHAPRNKDTRIADQCFHGITPKSVNLDVSHFSVRRQKTQTAAGVDYGSESARDSRFWCMQLR